LRPIRFFFSLPPLAEKLRVFPLSNGISDHCGGIHLSVDASPAAGYDRFSSLDPVPPPRAAPAPTELASFPFPPPSQPDLSRHSHVSLSAIFVSAPPSTPPRLVSMRFSLSFMGHSSFCAGTITSPPFCQARERFFRDLVPSHSSPRGGRVRSFLTTPKDPGWWSSISTPPTAQASPLSESREGLALFFLGGGPFPAFFQKSH